MAGRRFLPKLGFVPCSIIAGIVFLVIVALAQAIAESAPAVDVDKLKACGSAEEALAMFA